MVEYGGPPFLQGNSRLFFQLDSLRPDVLSNFPNTQ